MLLDLVKDASASAQLHDKMHAHLILKDVLHQYDQNLLPVE